MVVWIILQDGNIYAIHSLEETAKIDLEKAKEEISDFDFYSWEIVDWHVEY